jgi:hypothetical protein
MILDKKLNTLMQEVEVELQRSFVFAFWKLLFLFIKNTKRVKTFGYRCFTFGYAAPGATYAALVSIWGLSKLTMSMADYCHLFMRRFVHYFTVIVSTAMYRFCSIDKVLRCMLVVWDLPNLSVPSLFQRLVALIRHDVLNIVEPAPHTSMSSQVVICNLFKVAMNTACNSYFVVRCLVARFRVVVFFAVYLTRLLNKLICADFPISTYLSECAFWTPLSTKVVRWRFKENAAALLTTNLDRRVGVYVEGIGVIVLIAVDVVASVYELLLAHSSFHSCSQKQTLVGVTGWCLGSVQQ